MSETERLQREVEFLGSLVNRIAAEHDRVHRVRWIDHKARKRRPAKHRW